MKIKGLLLLSLMLVLLIIAYFIGERNGHTVLINYLLAETQIKMSVLLAMTFILGCVLSLVVTLGYVLRLKWRVSSLERKNKKLSQPTNAQ